MIDENSILHRRDDESDKAYEAWGIFRDLGPKRNMDMLKDKLGLKSKTHLYDWRDKYQWRERIVELQKIELQATMEAKQKALESREKSHLLELQSYQKLISLAKLALHNKLYTKDEEGNMKYDLSALEDLTVAELFEMTKDSSKFMINLINTERNILGLAGEIIENRFGEDEDAKRRIGNVIAENDKMRENFNKLLQEIEGMQNLDNIRD
jgi:hypothetical protein